MHEVAPSHEVHGHRQPGGAGRLDDDLQDRARQCTGERCLFDRRSPSRVGRQRQRASTPVVSSITTTVWLLVTPRSIPTMRRVVVVVVPFRSMDTAPTIRVLDGHGTHGSHGSA
ncbi:MAG: hypothetical protein LC799_21460 [Actinobacteria bacterium]|nr:hypothetical protein [Actinomycetota bacterium]